MCHFQYELHTILIFTKELIYYLTGKALMHYVDQYITIKALARETGINLQQLSHYAKRHRNPRPEMQEKSFKESEISEDN